MLSAFKPSSEYYEDEVEITALTLDALGPMESDLAWLILKKVTLAACGFIQTKCSLLLAFLRCLCRIAGPMDLTRTDSDWSAFGSAEAFLKAVATLCDAIIHGGIVSVMQPCALTGLGPTDLLPFVSELASNLRTLSEQSVPCASLSTVLMAAQRIVEKEEEVATIMQESQESEEPLHLSPKSRTRSGGLMRASSSNISAFLKTSPKKKVVARKEQRGKEKRKSSPRNKAMEEEEEKEEVEVEEEVEAEESDREVMAMREYEEEAREMAVQEKAQQEAREKLEWEAKEKEEKERAEEEEKAEKEKVAKEKAKKEKAEKEKAEKEKAEQEKADKAAKVEKEKAEKEKIEQEQQEIVKMMRESEEREQKEKEAQDMLEKSQQAAKERLDKLTKEKAAKRQDEKLARESKTNKLIKEKVTKAKIEEKQKNDQEDKANAERKQEALAPANTTTTTTITTTATPTVSVVKRALLVVDVQNDFCPPNGSLAVPDALSIIPIINSLRHKGEFDLIALSQDFHPSEHVSFQTSHPSSRLFEEITLPSGHTQIMWPTHCVQNTEGVAFHKALDTNITDSIIQKGTDIHVDSYSAFFDNERAHQTTLHALLLEHGIKEVYVVGLAHEFCVGFTALDAHSLGFATFVIADATRGVSESGVTAMNARFSANGVKLVQSNDFFHRNCAVELNEEVVPELLQVKIPKCGKAQASDQDSEDEPLSRKGQANDEDSEDEPLSRIVLTSKNRVTKMEQERIDHPLEASRNSPESTNKHDAKRTKRTCCVTFDSEDRDSSVYENEVLGMKGRKVETSSTKVMKSRTSQKEEITDRPSPKTPSKADVRKHKPEYTTPKGRKVKKSKHNESLRKALFVVRGTPGTGNAFAVMMEARTTAW